MATTSKQYKAIGDDIWKGRTEKVVRIRLGLWVRAARCMADRQVFRGRVERRAVCAHIRRTRGTADSGLRGLHGSQQAAGKDGLQHWDTSH